MRTNPSTRGRSGPGQARRMLAVAATALVATAGLVVPSAAAPVSPGEGPHVGAAIPDDWPGNSANPHGGTDYYIDATTGDDANPGTDPGQAWQNLAVANETTFSPGDRILLKAGEEWHDQQLWPKGDGTTDQPISIDAYGEPGERRPYIAANGTTPHPFVGTSTTTGTTDRTPTKDVETVGTTGAVVLRNQQGWEIANLELSNDDDFGTDITGGNVVRDGVSISINADLLADGDDKVMDYFRISNLYVHDIDGPSSWQSIHYGGVVFQVFGAEQYRNYEESAYYFQDVRIENNTFEDVELHAVQFAFNWFYDRDTGSGQYDEDGKWHEGWEQLWVRDRDLYSRDVYIGHNYAVGTGQGAIQLANTKDMVVEYNEVNGFLERYTQVSAGLYLWAGADTVMQFNEVYDGPYDEYDATPWDLEYTNFDVTYQYNYSHDNAGGWMAYMGNSSNSIARYNLSVNDNGVLVKNMLSTNYSPTYFLNNVFVYDGEQLEYVHDERFIDTVYFLNNVFYNTSETTTTTWYRYDDALRQAVFSNNAFYEASGDYSGQQPHDPAAVFGDPGFVSDVSEYERENGVRNIVDSASVFRIAEDSPLVDAGRYNPRLGSADFFGTPPYYGEAPDIGIHEVVQGDLVPDPVDENPIEEEGGSERENLALGKPITASSTHPHQDYALHAGNLVDGDTTTRWAAADDAEYPIELTIDLEEEVSFDEVYLDEHTDSGTDPRVQDFRLQRWDTGAGEWVTFYEGDSGIGRDLAVTFDEVTTTGLRVLLDGLRAGEVWSPTMTEIQVYQDAEEPEPAEPSVIETTGLYDLNPSVRDHANNSVSYGVEHDGADLQSIRYVGTEGNVLGSLDEGEEYTVEAGSGVPTRYALTTDFLTSLPVGVSGLQFGFLGVPPLRVDLVVVDSAELEAQIERGEAVEAADTPARRALAEAVAEARALLASVNRDVPGTGNDSVVQGDLDAAAAELAETIDEYLADVEQPTTEEPTTEEPTTEEPTTEEPTTEEPTTEEPTTEEPTTEEPTTEEPTTEEPTDGGGTDDGEDSGGTGDPAGTGDGIGDDELSGTGAPVAAAVLVTLMLLVAGGGALIARRLAAGDR